MFPPGDEYNYNKNSVFRQLKFAKKIACFFIVLAKIVLMFGFLLIVPVRQLLYGNFNEQTVLKCLKKNLTFGKSFLGFF